MSFCDKQNQSSAGRNKEGKQLVSLQTASLESYNGIKGTDKVVVVTVKGVTWQNQTLGVHVWWW